ncbi:MAG TPA: nucleotide sugar dehydrogenase [Solirubrobacteraceae bacterium]|jgi:UDP-glucose 6-dehydrogenase|nr:nucleotide sugar dehydrogenase [Solirubrobacteraceae bacterium]
MSATREPIGVIGTGYVGLVTAAGFAELGSDVWCVDIDAAKIERLKRGEVPIYEPGLEELLARNAARMRFSTDIADALAHARLLFVAVGTPPTYSGDADLSAVHAVADAIPASKDHALVMKSTVPCGTGASLLRVFGEQGKDALGYVSCPEFLKEGSAVADFLHPDRVVVGDEGGWAGDAVVELYAPLDAPLVRTDVASAEMVKLASNAFLATKISFINEIANVCEETGADVVEVARGMGLDDRIGPKFLQAGIGFGGSCFAPGETALVRQHGRTSLLSFEQLWERVATDTDQVDSTEALAAYGVGSRSEVMEPDGLEVLSWVRGEQEPRFQQVMALTRRPYQGELIEVRTKMGRRVRSTPDHPWLVGNGRSERTEVKLAFELTTEDWVPLAGERDALDESDKVCYPVDAAIEAAGLASSDVIVRPPCESIQALVARPVAERRTIFTHPRGLAARTGDVKRSGAVRLDEALRAELQWRDGTLATASNGARIPAAIVADMAFWRVVGLYLAEGNVAVETNGTTRIFWSFHPTREQHLVDEVMALWAKQGVRARSHNSATAQQVIVQSRLLGAFWTAVLGLGRVSYEQRLPDLAWDLPAAKKWALLSGLWEGDGSWSLVNGGPSVILELGTISDELADGVLRMLGDLGIVASRRIGRTAKSTKDTHWIRVSGADQIERAMALVPERDRPGVLAAIARQGKRIAPTGHRRLGAGPAWARIAELRSEEYDGHVYSLEVPYSHTVVTSGGVTTSNCFPKDVDALKQLAGNSGYHFQLLTAVIEVNELQKRRVIGKLHKHLGGLAGKRVALLGLAFKPNTDDMREASSLVLSARLHADGARVVAYDPVAEEQARILVSGIEFAGSPLAAVEGVDAVVLVTEWSEFLELDWRAVAAAMSGSVVIDGRNALDADAVRAAGLIYEGIGRR